MVVRNLLNQPYPLVDNNLEKLLWAFSFGGFVFLFIYIFKPFGFDSLGNLPLLVHALIFGGITFTIMISNLFWLPRQFPQFFAEERWTVGREISITLIHIFMIGIGNFIFARLAFELPISLKNFAYLQLITLAFAVIPITIWTLIKQNQLLKKNVKKAHSLNNSLGRNPEISGTPTQLVKIHSENKSDHGTFDLNQIRFISSYENYVKIALFNGGKLENEVLRSSLKKVEEDLQNFKMFYRCHRAYIVNLDHVKSVHGNARGLKLALENCDKMIPVSRALNQEITAKLQRRSYRSLAE